MSGLPGVQTHGRCQCRCECMDIAVVKVRTTRRGLLGWRRTPWVKVCLDCLPHLADQLKESGKIWRP